MTKKFSPVAMPCAGAVIFWQKAEATHVMPDFQTEEDAANYWRSIGEQLRRMPTSKESTAAEPEPLF